MGHPRKTKTFIAVITALSFGFSGLAIAQGDHDRDHDRPGPDHDHPGPGPGADHGRPPPPPHDRGRGAGPDHHFNKGDRLPTEYRGHEHAVDWRAHHLKAPPRGYQWVDVGGGDFVLAAITTGIIASILLSH